MHVNGSRNIYVPEFIHNSCSVQSAIKCQSLIDNMAFKDIETQKNSYNAVITIIYASYATSNHYIITRQYCWLYFLPR